ncbi:hypothetical protein UK12_34180, partial [Saccharothrix sp. ST-888]
MLSIQAMASTAGRAAGWVSTASMLAVVDGGRGRSVLGTTGSGVPAARAKLAARWRRSCRAMRGTPALSQ